MKSLTSLVAELETKLTFIEKKNKAVSQASVGWHLEHTLLALIKMITAVEHSTPADYKAKFNLKRFIVLLLGKIPRGKAKVPDAVNPPSETDIENVKGLIEKAKQKAIQFEQLNSGKFFTHPVFGDLRVKQARKVIAIHTQHHINIVDDIIKR